jgi:type IV pilus assembly protein PilA
MLSKMTKKNEGFTLIELMIVIAIIGILAAIAIPQFSAYRVRSFNAAANADLRNAATAQEAYYVDNGTYTNATTDLTANYGLFISD